MQYPRLMRANCHHVICIAAMDSALKQNSNFKACAFQICLALIQTVLLGVGFQKAHEERSKKLEVSFMIGTSQFKKFLLSATCMQQMYREIYLESMRDGDSTKCAGMPESLKSCLNLSVAVFGSYNVWIAFQEMHAGSVCTLPDLWLMIFQGDLQQDVVGSGLRCIYKANSMFEPSISYAVYGPARMEVTHTRLCHDLDSAQSAWRLLASQGVFDLGRTNLLEIGS